MTRCDDVSDEAMAHAMTRPIYSEKDAAYIIGMPEPDLSDLWGFTWGLGSDTELTWLELVATYYYRLNTGPCRSLEIREGSGRGVGYTIFVLRDDDNYHIEIDPTVFKGMPHIRGASVAEMVSKILRGVAPEEIAVEYSLHPNEIDELREWINQEA